MKSIITFLMLLFCAGHLFAGQPYIAPYLNDRQAAFSFTFDDGFKGEVNDALAIIDPLGIKGTFFLIPSRVGTNPASIDWAQAKQMQATGHEIGTHDSIKPKLHEISTEEVREKVDGGADLIEQNTGVRSVSFALPGGSEGTPEVLAAIRERHNFIRGGKYLPNASTSGYGSAGRRKWDDQQTRQQIEQAIEQGQWYIPIVHSIVGGYSPFASKEEFQTHCEWLVSKQDVLWIAPLGEVGRYVLERDAAKLDIFEQQPGKLAFKLAHTLQDKAVFNYPLTVVIPDTGATSAEALDEDRNPVSASVQDGKILVNAVPNGKAVWVRWQ